jgi:hypothetical protein
MEEWMPFNEAATRLGVNVQRIAKLVKSLSLEVRRNPLDEREKLVNMAELTEKLNRSRRA